MFFWLEVEKNYIMRYIVAGSDLIVLFTNTVCQCFGIDT